MHTSSLAQPFHIPQDYRGEDGLIWRQCALPGCDQWFVKKTWNHKFCSDGCKHEANYWRNHDYYVTNQKYYQAVQIQQNIWTKFKKHELKKMVMESRVENEQLRKENDQLRKENAEIQILLSDVLKELRELKAELQRRPASSGTPAVFRPSRDIEDDLITVSAASGEGVDASANFLKAVSQFVVTKSNTVEPDRTGGGPREMKIDIPIAAPVFDDDDDIEL